MTRKITKELEQAYNATEYVVYDDNPITLKIGHKSSSLMELMQRCSVNCCAFITAFNPYSLNMTETENLQRNEGLRDDLIKLDCTFYGGVGQDPSGNWPPENSFLILGISKTDAESLGRKYEQNAILWINHEALPELVLL